MTHRNSKQMLNLFSKIGKIGKIDKIDKIDKDCLMQNMSMNKKTEYESKGVFAFLNGRSRCIKLTPKTFNCNIKFNKLYFDVNETFQSGLGKTWDDYKNDIPKIENKNKEWYSTVYSHNKDIYDYGNKLTSELYNIKEYSPKFAYEQCLYQMSFILAGFYQVEQASNNLNEFVDKLTRYEDNDKLKKQITIVAEEYWIK
jgi:hypothetical protein